MRAWPAAQVVPAALSKEWLLGNGLGDLAFGTVLGAQVRPFHAHLVLADPSAGLVAVLLRLDARLIEGDRTFELVGLEDPVGSPPHADLLSFVREPWPTWRYRADEVTIEKRALLLHDRHGLVVQYRHVEGPPARVTVAPSFAASAEGLPRPATHSMPGRIRVTIGAEQSATVWHNGGFMPSRPGDRVPYVPGFIETGLAEGEALLIVVSSDEHMLRDLAEADRLGTPPPRTLAGCVAAIETHERARLDIIDRTVLAAANATAREARAARAAHARRETAPGGNAQPARRSRATTRPAEVVLGAARFGADDPWLFRLARSLELGFTVPERGDSIVHTVPTGVRSGEAALRCVRGLVALRSYERAREILLTYGQLIREGLVPSGFDDAGKPIYAAPEPSLWFVIATELFARRSGELEFVRRALYPSIEQVIDRYREGTRLGVGVADDGLLASGEGDDRTKRADLNALWYAAQAAAGQLARAVGRQQHGAFYLAWAREHQTRVNELLWDEEAGCVLAALTTEPVRDIRPSLALTASLAPPLLGPERALRLVDTLERVLWTPAGMREAPGGRQLLTEWLEPFFTAWLRAHGRTPEAQQRVRGWMEDLATVTDQHAAGHVPERFEAAAPEPHASKPDAPRPPRGKKSTARARQDGSVPNVAGSRVSAADGPLESREPGTSVDVHYAGDPVSVLASTELLRLWIEEIDRGGEER